jgi:outer membrane putative beta-barrel porin/alpha-amylase
MMARALVVFLALACVAAPCVAQDDRVEPDRPDVTNGPHLVDVGLLQVEGGGLYSRATSNRNGFGSPLAVRVGLTEWLEARVSNDGVVTHSERGIRQTGIGNTQVGAKLRVWADPGGVSVVSLLPTIAFPTADAGKGLGSGDRDYLVAVLSGADIGRGWHADGNYGIGRIGAGDGAPHFTQHLVSVSVSTAATDNLNPYVEAFWFSRQEPDGPAIGAIDAGAIYEVGARYAIDGGLEVTVSGQPHDVAVFGGLSFIVGNILGQHGVHARQRQIQRRRSQRSH